MDGNYGHSITKKWILFAGLFGVALLGAAFLHHLSQAQPDAQALAAPAPGALAEARFVSALGRLEPEGKVIRLTAATGMEGARVARLLVAEGDLVRAGQIMAMLDNHETQRATVEAAERRLEVAIMRLAQIAAGAKRSEIFCARSRSQPSRSRVAPRPDRIAPRRAFARLRRHLHPRTE